MCTIQLGVVYLNTFCNLLALFIDSLDIFIYLFSSCGLWHELSPRWTHNSNHNMLTLQRSPKLIVFCYTFIRAHQPYVKCTHLILLHYQGVNLEYRLYFMMNPLKDHQVRWNRSWWYKRKSAHQKCKFYSQILKEYDKAFLEKQFQFDSLIHLFNL